MLKGDNMKSNKRLFALIITIIVMVAVFLFWSNSASKQQETQLTSSSPKLSSGNISKPIQNSSSPEHIRNDSSSQDTVLEVNLDETGEIELPEDYIVECEDIDESNYEKLSISHKEVVTEKLDLSKP